MPDKIPNVLVIGAGMYVCGRGTSTFGTILPTLIQNQKQGLINEITVAATSQDSINTLNQQLNKINNVFGTSVTVNTYPRHVRHDTNAYKQALSEMTSPACAIIVVPDHLHHDITKDVIESGIHPLVVKPFTATTSEAHNLINLANQHKVYGAVEFHKRFDESNLILRQTIRDGRLGDISYITVEYSQRRIMREIFKNWVNQTNIFQYLGVHYVDLIYFLTEATPIKVLATGQPDQQPPSHTGYDSIQTLIEWQILKTKQSFISTIVTNWIDPDNTSAVSDQKITVVGTEGRYQADQKNRGVQLVTQNTSGLEEINPYFSQIYEDENGNIKINGYGPKSITSFISDVIDLINKKCKRAHLIEKRSSFEKSLVSSAVIEAANESLRNGNQWTPVIL